MSILNQRNPKKVKTMLKHEKCLVRRHLSLSVDVAEVNLFVLLINTLKCLRTIHIYGQDIFSSPIPEYRKSYCTTPGIGFGIGVNKNVKVLNQSFDGFSLYLV